jgi:hypothetical protein
MRQCINGAGADTTAAVAAYLAATDKPLIRDLVMIGDPSDPNAILMTNHEAPVIYPPWGTFKPAVLKRGGVTTKIGLEVQKITLTWTPGSQQTGVTIATANPMQLAAMHYYDNWPVRIWRCFMPTPGDASTLGACEWFGGRVGGCVVGRNQIDFSVSSFLDVVSQKLPPNVIESTSTLAGYTAASKLPTDASVPTFSVFTGSTTNSILGDSLTPVANHIYGTNVFVAGYMVFLDGPGATLAGVWSAIGGNLLYNDGHGNNHNRFNIYTPLPWAPTPTVDKFYVSTAAPINFADGTNIPGFPFCPQPQMGAT